MKQMKEQINDLDVGDLIMVRYGQGLEKAKIVGKRDGETFWELCFPYGGLYGYMEESREWFYLRRSLKKWLKDLLSNPPTKQ